MKNENYLKALQYFSENNVNLNKDQLSILENRINTSEVLDEYTIVPDSQVLGLIADYVLESNDIEDNVEDYLFESANSDIKSELKSAKKRFSAETKAYKKNVRSGDYKGAKKNLSNMTKIINDAESKIRSIDASSIPSKIGGFLRVFGVDIAVILMSAVVASEAQNDLVHKAKSNNDYVAHAAATTGVNDIKDIPSDVLQKAQDDYHNFYDGIQYWNHTGKDFANRNDPKFKEYLTKNLGHNFGNILTGDSDKDIQALAKLRVYGDPVVAKKENPVKSAGLKITQKQAVAVGTTPGVIKLLYNAVEVLKQFNADRKSGDDKEKANSWNAYREKVLSVLAAMRKQIATMEVQLDKASK